MYKNNKKIIKIYKNNKFIERIYLGIKIVWAAINSAFAAGWWNNDLPYSNEDGWID